MSNPYEAPRTDSATAASPDFAGSMPPPMSAIDSLTAEVLAQLEQIPAQRTWVQTLILLGLSLFIFSVSGFMHSTLPELLLLVGILLFHETGHYVGMRLFNYQDVRMFFIPFFGAAVSGRSTSVAGYKEAIVILLGPLPGILLGLVLGIVCWFHDEALLRSAALTLLLINGFNLLPFMPLDGGRLLHLVLFSRQRHLEALFRVATGLLLALCGWALQAWLLAGLGAFMALTTGYTFRVSTLAQRLRRLNPLTTEASFSAQIPAEQALPLVISVREAFPQFKQAKPIVNTVRQIWERMHLRSPGVLASIALLVVYVGALLGTPVAMALLPLRDLASQVEIDAASDGVEDAPTTEAPKARDRRPP